PLAPGAVDQHLPANPTSQLKRERRASPQDSSTPNRENRRVAAPRDVWAGIGPTVMAGIGDAPALGASALVTLRGQARPRGSWQWLPDVGLGASYLRLEDSLERVAARGDLWTADVRLSPVRWTA